MPKVSERQREINKNWYQNNKERLKEEGILREKALLRNYGVTLEMYEDMFLEQNGKCAICNNPETARFKGELRNLCVDHCHDSSDIRGLLCHACNLGLGYFKDNKEALQNAIEYLNNSIQ